MPSWVKTHEISTGIYSLELERYLDTSPSVAKLPLVDNNLRLNFSCSNDLGMGFLNYTLDTTLLNDSDLLDSFLGDEIFKTRLRIKSGSNTKWLLVPSPVNESIVDEPAFKITFVDGSFKAVNLIQRQYFPSISPLFLEFYVGMAELAGWEGDFRVFHEWKNNDWADQKTLWEPTIGTIQTQIQVLQQTYFQAATKFFDAAELFTNVHLSLIGQSSSLNGAPVYINALDDFGATSSDSTIAGWRVNKDNSPTPLFVGLSMAIYDTVTEGSVTGEIRNGLSRIRHSFSNDPGDSIERTDELAGFLSSYERDLEILKASIGNPRVFVNVTASNPDYDAITGVNRSSPSTVYTLAEALNFTINKVLGGNNIVASMELHHVVDPMFPFILDLAIKGSKYIFRAVEGSIHLDKVLTVVNKAQSLGEYT